MAAPANAPIEEGNGRGRQRPIIPGPTNPMATPLLTDLYQFTMAYAYWKAGRHNERAVYLMKPRYPIVTRQTAPAWARKPEASGSKKEDTAPSTGRTKKLA